MSYDSAEIAMRKDDWVAAGSPAVPALVIGGIIHSVSHPVQIASALGLTLQAAEDLVRVGWDIDTVLEAWLECVRLAPWESWLEPTPSRERTTLELAVNSFVPIALLPDAWRTGYFPWGTLDDWPPGQGITAYEAEIRARCEDTEAFVRFAERIRLGWSAFLVEEEANLMAAPDREVEMARGPAMSFGRVLEAQRIHAAQHYRQVAEHLRSTGRALPAFELESLHGLALPRRVY